jgi:hypothetical protein
MKLYFYGSSGVRIDDEYFSFEYMKEFWRNHEFNIQNKEFNKSIKRQHNKIKFFFKKYPEYLI